MKHIIEQYSISLTGEHSDMLAVRKPPKNNAEIEAIRAAKPEIVALLQERKVQAQAEYAAAQAVRQAERDAVDQPEIKKMEQRAIQLRSLIPADHVEVTVTKVGDSDGYPILEYVADGVSLKSADVTVHGWASAIRPGAMGAFREVCVASISRGLLAEIGKAQAEEAAQKIAAENQAAAELAQKFEDARTTGQPVMIKSYMADCNDPREECSTDVVTEYAMPGGSTKTERRHTW